MRKRWDFDPIPIFAAWFFGGMAAWLVLMALTNGCDRGGCGMNADGIHGAAPVIGLVVWLAPIVVPLVVAAIVDAGRALWDALPRRVVEPVADDLRSVERPS